MFFGCAGLSSVVIPDSVTSIGAFAFSGCVRLADKDGFVIIRNVLYSHYGNGAAVIPDGVTEIEEYAFDVCENLISVSIPRSVTILKENVFRKCTDLSVVIIPDSVTKISRDSFISCPNITIVCREGSYAHRYSVRNHFRFIFDFLYEAFGGLIPQGFEMLSSPFLADEEQPFIFISYSHKDRERVLPILKTLYESGWRIWYDEGLTIGDSYDETLEEHVKNCSAFLLFVTENSLNSLYIEENEIPWAIRFEKPIVKCILDEGQDYEINESRIVATVSPTEIEPALGRINGLTKGERREAKGISVAVDPANRSEAADGDGFAYCLYAPQSTATAKAILLEAKNSGCMLYDAVENGADKEQLQSAACLIVFLDKAFLSDQALTKHLTEAYQAGRELAVCRLEDVEADDYPPELRGLDKMHALNFVHGITSDMNKKLARHLQKRGCRNTAVLPGFEYGKTKKGIVIKEYFGTDPNPTIANEYAGIPVTKIMTKAFLNCYHLKALVIPKGVKKIEENAFEGCTSLTSITIPNSVTKIGGCTFKGCSSLTSIVIPDSITEIGEKAFEGCSSLTSVVIPNSVTGIEGCAFKGCSSLTSVVIPDSITEIGGCAFKGCSSLSSINIPDSVTEIGSKTFSGCRSLTSVVIPDSVTEIGWGVFEYCSSLTSIVIPNSVTVIRSSTFRDCIKLASIVIPENTAVIGSSAFSNCTNLSSVTIPDSVSAINGDAFSNCKSLTSIAIPDSVSEIGEGAFQKCINLTSVILSNRIKRIERWTFYGCISLISVNVPDSVIYIGVQAFGRCVSLTSITIFANLWKIANNAFDGCTNITVFCPPDSLVWKCCKQNRIPVKAPEDDRTEPSDIKHTQEVSSEDKKNKTTDKADETITDQTGSPNPIAEKATEKAEPEERQTKRPGLFRRLFGK